jgi:diguanylate cyclase (GGDEF)-like protein
MSIPSRHTHLLAIGRGGVWGATALLVLAGIVAAVLGSHEVARSDTDRARLASHLAAADIASTLKLAIRREEDLTVSMSAFVIANPKATAARFDTWVESMHAMQRYPELQNIGLVSFVAASQLIPFEARMAAHPLRPFGPQSLPPKGISTILPPGKRPYYCLAVAGVARNTASYLPTGLDYCAEVKAMITVRDSGLAGYAPVVDVGTTALGVETPVYRGGVTPPTIAARRRAFVGWLGERLEPKIVLERALAGRADVAVDLRYDSHFSHVDFTSGAPVPGSQSTEISLDVGREAGLESPSEGWTVRSYSGPVAGGIFGDLNALVLLIGGILLSTLLGLFLLVLGRGHARAQRLVREKTRELSEKNHELSHLALHDALTGLPNRALVLDRAKQMLARIARRPNAVAGALFIDIDGFKRVNDNLGHAAGDHLLTLVGKRLQSAVRDQDTVGRLGGDEFVVLVESSADEVPIHLLAGRLTEILRAPMELDEQRKSFTITASIGVAAGRYEAPDALLRDADLALYTAKAAGKDCYSLFDASMHTGAEGKIELEAALESAIAEQRFFLVYQPIFTLPSHELVGAEALIRWRHPTRGVVDPGSFIPLAEENGLIAPIGRWVLDHACRQAAAWASEGHAIGIAVNVSAYQLGRAGFTEDVRAALTSSGIDPSLLSLEITETALMRDVPAACASLQELKVLGVRVAIDDFGTGYASLAYLQRMPVDLLKIDQSFIAALDDGPQGRELLEAILGMARSLSLIVIAEGIETPTQLRAIEQLGCHLGQGYFLGHPTPPKDIEALFATVNVSGGAGYVRATIDTSASHPY